MNICICKDIESASRMIDGRNASMAINRRHNLEHFREYKSAISDHKCTEEGADICIYIYIYIYIVLTLYRCQKTDIISHIDILQVEFKYNSKTANTIRRDLIYVYIYQILWCHDIYIHNIISALLFTGRF